MTLAAIFAATIWCCGQLTYASNHKVASKLTAAETSTQNKVTTAKSTSAKSSSSVQQPASKAPVALSAVQRGEKVFKKAYCEGCHAGGYNAMSPDKPIKGSAFLQKYKDDLILENTIRKGFPDEGMPAFGKDQISESQMKDLILYIRSLSSTK
ncbi:MAG: cytochrome c [Cyanobacteria bacterium SZAS LIN-5]|nr:cytochrome c [Cyanobacteria bacterium SZAS LIN-5]